MLFFEAVDLCSEVIVKLSLERINFLLVFYLLKMQIILQPLFLFFKLGDLKLSLLAQSHKLHAIITQLIILLIIVLL